MGNRILRVSELIQREISAYLHTRYQAESVRITITGVRVAPDFRDGVVYYSVLGGPEVAGECGRWLQAKAPEIRHLIGRQIVLKNVPLLEFVYDAANERSARIERILDELGPPPAGGPA